MTTKTAYQFDFAGLYAGTTEADESPLEPGVFLLPAGTTFKAPPKKIPEGKWPRWNGSAWKLATRPQKPEEDPVAKLTQFLLDNPDVAEIVNLPSK